MDAIWRYISGKIVWELWGLNPKTVVLRSVFVTLEYLLVYICLHTLALGKTPNLKSEQYFAGTAASVTTVGWALFILFNKEFVSKYERLASIHDNHLELGEDAPDLLRQRHFSEMNGFLAPPFLNFAEDCLAYHLDKSVDFIHTFECTIHALTLLFEQDKSQLGALLVAYPRLAKFLRTLLSHGVSPALKAKREKRMAYLGLTMTIDSFENSNSGD